MAEINLKTLNILNNLGTSMDEFGPVGIIDTVSVEAVKNIPPVSKKMQFLKSSAKNRIQISITKKIVISVSKI